jgi:hypothetical protein
VSHTVYDSALPAAGLVGLVGLTLAAYVPFINTGFAATDSLPLIENSRLANLASIARLFTTPVMAGSAFTLGETVYRPFVSLTFGFDYMLWGADSAGYHLSNLVLHVLAVGAVWVLLNTLGLSRLSSLLGAAIFALHPVVVATVPVIARRDSVVPVVAFAAAAVLVLLAEDSRARRRAVLLGISLLLAAVALLSKEAAFVAVAMLPILLAARAIGRGAGLYEALKSTRFAIPFLILAAFVFAVRLAVLHDLGGMSDVDPGFVDPYRYGVLFGAYTRNLLWAFADLAPAPREVWLRLAILIAVSLALTLIWLPRRHAVLAAAGALWVISFGVFCAVFKISTMGWLAYFSLIGVALLLAAGLEGAVAQLRAVLRPTGDARALPARPGRAWRSPLAGSGRAWHAPLANVSSVILLVGLLVFAAASLRASALFQAYPQWHLAGDVEQRYMEALAGCVAAAPDATQVSLQRVPGSFDDGRSDTVMLGVTLIEQYTAESALRMAFPDRQVAVHVDSTNTLGPGAELEFSCAHQGDHINFRALY